MNFNSEMWAGVTSIFLAVASVAALAVFLSKNSNTAGIAQAAFGGFSDALSVAENPGAASDASLTGASFGS